MALNANGQRLQIPIGAEHAPITIDIPRFRVADVVEGIATLAVILYILHLAPEQKDAQAVANGIQNLNNQPAIHLSSPAFPSSINASSLAPEGVLPFKETYSDNEIEAAVSSPLAVPGANAILVDIKSSRYGIPVRILPQIPGTGITKIEFQMDGQVFQSQTTPDDLKLPAHPLKNWWPSDNPELPPGNIISETISESQRGVDWINELLKKNGVTNTSVKSGGEIKTNLLLNGGAYDQTSCSILASGKANCVQDVPIPRYATSVRGADGGDLNLDDKTYMFLNYIDPIHWANLIFKTLHEKIHTTTAGFGFVEKYYQGDSANVPSAALEKFTDALAAMAVENVYISSETDPERLKALRIWTRPEDHHSALKWLDKIAMDLQSKGKGNLSLVLRYGAAGDMVRLQNLYDDAYGAGNFAKTLNQ